MAWDFSTEPEFQARLDRASEFVGAECEPLDLALPHPHEFQPPTAEVRKGIVDGPTETIARQLLKDREPSQGAWPSRWLLPRVGQARQRYADAIESVVGNL